MNKKLFNLLLLVLSCFIAFTCIFAAVTEKQSPEENSITILFTNSGNGRLNACPTCPNLLYGGMPRRAALIKEFRKTDKNILLLDSGDFFPVLAPKDQAEYVIKSMNLMGYDAAEAGDQEFMYGRDYLQDASARMGFPLVSATLAYENEGGSRLFSKPYIIKNAGKFKVLITGVINERSFLFFPKDKIQGITFLDPATELKKIVDGFRDKVDFIIVLSHLGDAADENLAKDVSGIDLIIGGHTQTLIEKPVKAGNTLIVQAGKNGERLGKITFKVAKGSVSANLALFPGQSTRMLYISRKDSTVTVSDYRVILLDEKIPDDKDELKLVDEYAAIQQAALKASAPDTRAARAETVVLGKAVPFILSPWSVDLGTAKTGSDINFAIALKNIGSEPVEIRKIRASCDCLLPSLEKGTIQPQESADVNMRFTPDGPAGSVFEYYLYVESNDPTEQVSAVKITGAIEEDQNKSTVHGPQSTAKEYQKNAKIAKTSKKEVKKDAAKVKAEFFYSPGCRQCEDLKTRFLPDLRSEFSGSVNIDEYDISVKENYERLVKFEEKYGVKKNASAEVFIGSRVLLGSAEIKKKFRQYIIEELARNAPSARETVTVLPLQIAGSETESGIMKRFRSFGPAAVIAAGLIDGVNPCAFATIIFFISFLTYVGRSRRDILLNGIFFAAGVFCAYFLLGIGLFKVIQSISAFKVVSEIILYAIFILALLLGFLSARDAYLYAKTGDPGKIALQLPRPVKESIHFWIRKSLNTPAIIAGSFVTGLLVSLLEAVCTGQIYLPTLAFMTRDPVLASKAYFYLVLYNIMFILPLIAVFLFAYFGAGSKKLAEFSQKNVVPVKIITAIFFFSLAVLLLVMK